ncbi:hypothetical protein HanRHA438_Chr09g0384671 [Helianthus annuus]|nr:hypothetical protein HanRHA438_Chr09g0384671 [Helianthus annuus]
MAPMWGVMRFVTTPFSLSVLSSVLEFFSHLMAHKTLIYACSVRKTLMFHM